MAWIGTLLAVALAGIAGGAWWLLERRRMSLAMSLGVVALAAWLLSVSIVWLVDDEESAPAARRPQSGASLAWPGTTTVPGSSVGPPTVGVQAASVESLVGGLEARLEQQPNDPDGWVLLAQSYAYAADGAGVERAVRRAVELGVDEQMLRGRVAGASRRTQQPLDAVEEALRAREFR